MKSGSAIFFVIALLFVTSQALTDYEIVVLITNQHSTIANTSNFAIELTVNNTVLITIGGIPQHFTVDCYNTSLGCCRPEAQIRPHPRTFEVPRNPLASNMTYCTPQGAVGVTTGGTVFYNHLEDNCVGVNNLVSGTYDFCNGRPGRNNGEYHFNRAPNPVCVGNINDAEPHIIGVALDGFAIYDSSLYNGVQQKLDECGGFAPEGDQSRYRYVSSYDQTNPTDHVIPCFKGIPLKPKCCVCRECNRAQLPGCKFDRRPVGSLSPFLGGSGFPRRRPRWGLFGRPSGNRPFFPFGGSSERRRPFGRPAMRPDIDLVKGEGYCTRDQVRSFVGNSRQQPLACNQCPVCVPAWGYGSSEEAKRYTACRRCQFMEQRGRGRNPQPGTSSGGSRRTPNTNRSRSNFLSILQYLLG